MKKKMSGSQRLRGWKGNRCGYKDNNMKDACGDGNGLYLVSMSIPWLWYCTRVCKTLSTGYLNKEDTGVSDASVFLPTTVSGLTIILIKKLIIKYKEQHYYSSHFLIQYHDTHKR